MAKSLFNISFPFLFFSSITKVEYRKISHDKSQSHKMCDDSHRMVMLHMESQVTVIAYNKEVS